MGLKAVAAVFLMSSSAWGFATGEFNRRPEHEVVLGYDKTVYPDQSPLKFPCTQAQGQVSCDPNAVYFQNEVCGRTFHISRKAYLLELSCTIRFQKILIGTVDTREPWRSSSDPAISYLPIRYTSQVSFKSVMKPRPNGFGWLEIVIAPSLR